MAENKKVDTAMAQARQRAERLAKAGPGRNPKAAGDFVRETIVELKKTLWPSTIVLWKSVQVVLFFILATAIWVGSLDSLLRLVGDHIYLGNSK